MSDHLVRRLQAACHDPQGEPLDCEGSGGKVRSNATVADVEASIIEIARLRAWRDAINDALTNWLDALTDDDTPKDALRRLIQYEITAALDPAVSQSAANLVSIARDDALDAVLARVRHYEGIAYQHGSLPHMDPQECAAQAAREIAASIRAMKDREP